MGSGEIGEGSSSDIEHVSVLLDDERSLVIGEVLVDYGDRGGLELLKHFFYCKIIFYSPPHRLISHFLQEISIWTTYQAVEALLLELEVVVPDEGHVEDGEHDHAED